MTVTGNDDSIKCDTVSELKAELAKLLGPKDVGDTSAFNAYLPKKGVSQTFTIHCGPPVEDEAIQTDTSHRSRDTYRKKECTWTRQKAPISGWVGTFYPDWNMTSEQKFDAVLGNGPSASRAHSSASGQRQ